jgi:hypothetical protein
MRKQRRVEKQNPNADTGRGSSDSAAPAAKPVPQQAEVYRVKRHWLDYATGLCAFIAAIGAIFAAYFGGRQAWVASDAEVRQLRAYVHVTPGKLSLPINPEFDGPLYVAVQPGVKIFGQTPAGQVAVPWALVVHKWPMTDEFPFSYLRTRMESTSSLAPGEERLVGDVNSRTITKEELSDIAAGRKRLYAYGTVIYRDVFNNTRFTNFCWTYDVAALVNRTAADCPIHNGADWIQAGVSGVPVPMK